MFWLILSRELICPTLGKGKSSSKVPGGDMSVPTRVLFENKGLRLHFVKYYSTTHLNRVGWQGLAICERCEGRNFWNHAVQIDWTTKNLKCFQHPAFTPTFLLPLQQVLAGCLKSFWCHTFLPLFWSKATGTRSGKISSLFDVVINQVWEVVQKNDEKWLDFPGRVYLHSHFLRHQLY